MPKSASLSPPPDTATNHAHATATEASASTETPSTVPSANDESSAQAAATSSPSPSASHSDSGLATDDSKSMAPQSSDQPPLPDEAPPLPDEAPPLPDEAPPLPEDDGWQPVWDAAAQGYYFYNRFTQKTQWENPRVPEAIAASGSGLDSHDKLHSGQGDAGDGEQPVRLHGGYNPAIHGDYDPTADYAIEAQQATEQEEAATAAAVAAAVAQQAANQYAASASFNRFTGRWQAGDINPERHNDENKSHRQMNAYFDVDAAANSHDGRSLKAERQNKRFSRQEIKAFKEKRRERKEEKRRAWLRD